MPLPGGAGGAAQSAGGDACGTREDGCGGKEPVHGEGVDAGRCPGTPGVQSRDRLDRRRGCRRSVPVLAVRNSRALWNIFTPRSYSGEGGARTTLRVEMSSFASRETMNSLVSPQ
jgi:hypothetical protein